MKTRHEDGNVHFSQLKKFSLSPAHYLVACEEETEANRAMRLGSAVHFIVLGPRQGQRIVRFEGKDRRAKGWKEFEEANQGAEILTAPEWADAEEIAAAVKRDPVAARLLEGARTEVPLTWKSHGLSCATSGVDFIGQGYFGELKTMPCTEPSAMMRHCARMLYHAQLAFYEEGAVLNKIDVSGGVFLIGVEVRKPYAVTALQLTERTILQGKKAVTLWLERLRACEESGQFPAYAQSVVPFDLPEWELDVEGLPDDEEAA